MVSIDLAGFSADGASAPAAYTTLLEENTPIYVVVTDILAFLPAANGCVPVFCAL